MQKCIIISIRPEWVEKILNGEKTIEIRKSMPKCELPIDVYIYCTKGDINLYKVFREVYMYFDMGVAEPFEDFKYYKLNGYDYSNKGKARFEIENGFYDELYRKLNGKIVAKFTLNKVSNVIPYLKSKQDGKAYGKLYINYDCDCGDVTWGNQTCLEQLDLENYLGLKRGYAWHIDNLEIFDKPMELSDFKTQCKDYYNGWSGCDYSCGYAENKQCFGGKIALKKAPQSWCYAWR